MPNQTHSSTVYLTNGEAVAFHRLTHEAAARDARDYALIVAPSGEKASVSHVTSRSPSGQSFEWYPENLIDPPNER